MWGEAEGCFDIKSSLQKLKVLIIAYKRKDLFAFGIKSFQFSVLFCMHMSNIVIFELLCLTDLQLF